MENFLQSLGLDKYAITFQAEEVWLLNFSFFVILSSDFGMFN